VHADPDNRPQPHLHYKLTFLIHIRIPYHYGTYSLIIPAGFYEMERRRVELRERLELLEQLTNTRARIAVKIDFEDGRHSGDTDWSHVFLHVRSPGLNSYLPVDHPERNDTRSPDQLAAARNHNLELLAEAENCTLKLVWQTIFPTLIDLQAEGHLISLADSQSLCD
jgi:hypothetical protein